MKSVSLSAFPRSQTRRKGARAVRANERVPAIIYGRHMKPESLELTEKDLENKKSFLEDNSQHPRKVMIS